MSETPHGPIAILRDIQQKKLDAKLLGESDRRLCVEYLVGEGYPVQEIAELFKCSIRTVQRDLARIRKDHSITSSPEVHQQMIGQLILHAQQGITRLRKLGRDRATPPAVQVEAERSAWQILKELIELLQRMGILPTAAQELRADIHHVVAEVPSVQEMQRIVATIERECKPADGTAGVLGQLSAVRGLLAQATAASVLQDLKAEEAGANDAAQ